MVSSGNLLAALASAAQVAAEYSEDDERQKAEAARAEREAAEAKVNHHLTPEGRLASVLEVNRRLHAALAEKKSLLKESQEEIKNLNSLLQRREVEEPARRHYIEEMQESAVSENSGAAGRELKMMLRDIVKMEAKVNTTNEDNLILSEKHRLDRARMAEQQSRLRTLGKRERELAKNLDHLATKLNEAVAAVEKPSSSKEASQEQQEISDLAIDKFPIDFRNLPGLRLNKLVGKNPDRPPPSLVLAPGASAPTLAPAAAPPTAAEDAQHAAKDGVAESPSNEVKRGSLREASLKQGETQK